MQAQRVFIPVPTRLPAPPSPVSIQPHGHPWSLGSQMQVQAHTTRSQFWPCGAIFLEDSHLPHLHPVSGPPEGDPLSTQLNKPPSGSEPPNRLL